MNNEHTVNRNLRLAHEMTDVESLRDIPVRIFITDVVRYLYRRTINSGHIPYETGRVMSLPGRQTVVHRWIHAGRWLAGTGCQTPVAGKSVIIQWSVT